MNNEAADDYEMERQRELERRGCGGGGAFNPEVARLRAELAVVTAKLADAQALIVELEGDPESDEDNFSWLPKYARYAIEFYRKKYPK